MAPRGLEIAYLANHGPHGPAAARNRGWQAARAAIIAFTDDDTVPDADWLRNGLLAFDDDADALWGRIIMPLPERPTIATIAPAGLSRSTRRSTGGAVGP